MLESKENNQK